MTLKRWGGCYLIDIVVEKTGLPHDQAEQAAQAVIGFLKEKLPEPLAGQLDLVLGSSSDQLGALAKGLGGLLGR